MEAEGREMMNMSPDDDICRVARRTSVHGQCSQLNANPL